MLWTDGNVMQNVFNALISGAGGPWDNEDAIGDALTWIDDIYANLTTFTSDEIDGSQIQGYKYDVVGDDWDEFASENWTWAPADGNEQLPRGVSSLINLKTEDPDVSGKKYFGGQGENLLEDGLWHANLITQLILAGVDWVTDFVGSETGASWAPGVWSPTNKAFYNAGTVMVIPFIPAYQRRRKRGIGI
jgi:hypothetical protein